LGITLNISFISGALTGWLVTKFTSHPEELFDDSQHFAAVEYPQYAGDIELKNVFSEAVEDLKKPEYDIAPTTGRTDQIEAEA